MDIWQVDKLVLFLAFFIPGFISLKVYDLLVPGERRDFSKSFPEAVAYSALNYAALSWLVDLILSGNFYDDHKTYYFLSLFLIMFVIPVLWPFVFLKLSSWAPIAKHVVRHPFPEPWDYVFGRREISWVIVHLKDGRRIGGKFGIDSFASSYPAGEQVYLEEVWELDEKGRFIKAIDRSRGVIILGEDLVAVEFFSIE